jgi:hypothetical protein
MSYIDRLIEADEEVVRRAKLPRRIFVPSVLFLIGAVAALGNQMLGLGMLLLIFAALAGIYAGVLYSASEFALTTKRVMARVGFKRKPPWAVPLEQVADLKVERGLLGKLLGSGTVRIEDSSGGVREMKNLAAPEEFVRRVKEEREARGVAA